jgi:dihydroorotate dehydrogenase (NAD+) catalytic subunit
MLWEVYRANLGVPLVGIGGITTANDAIEYMIVGASAVEIGTANLIDPEASVKVVEGVRAYCSENRIKNISEIVGTLKC